jgi:hypothetical protein
MNFFKNLARLFRGGSSGGNNRMLTVYLLSRRCNEPIAGQVDLLNELSQTEEGDAHPFYARKVFRTSGERRCFDQVEVELWFNQGKAVVEHQVTGGRWLEPAEYEQEVARFNTPPAEEEE